ncbi:superoxide dismutase [Actinomyces ruminis]|uniref:Superoxide dismutase n=1 Tax=Actinomyces ruminis TaxID=1937003 RepID=A0ABX4MAZ9_9ACTO|nr:superoxide dismutase [Actinomyces ruminis]
MVIGGCGITHPEDYPVDGPTFKATSNPAEVHAEDFGHSWNLNVDSGVVGCEFDEDGDPALTFTSPDGTVYALNAVEANDGLPEIGDIAGGSVGYLRTFAFTVCEAGDHG